jgi:hypothetical protein
MTCNHLSFEVAKHDYCPDCGEDDVRKIIDERLVARLEADIERLNAAIAQAADACNHFDVRTARAILLDALDKEDK